MGEKRFRITARAAPAESEARARPRERSQEVLWSGDTVNHRKISYTSKSQMTFLVLLSSQHQQRERASGDIGGFKSGKQFWRHRMKMDSGCFDMFKFLQPLKVSHTSFRIHFAQNYSRVQHTTLNIPTLRSGHAGRAWAPELLCYTSADYKCFWGRLALGRATQDLTFRNLHHFLIITLNYPKWDPELDGSGWGSVVSQEKYQHWKCG